MIPKCVATCMNYTVGYNHTLTTIHRPRTFVMHSGPMCLITKCIATNKNGESGYLKICNQLEIAKLVFIKKR